MEANTPGNEGNVLLGTATSTVCFKAVMSTRQHIFLLQDYSYLIHVSVDPPPTFNSIMVK